MSYDICTKQECASVPVEVTDDFIKNTIPKRDKLSHKGDFGKLLIIAGSDDMSGASALNVKAALRSGAGLVKLASTLKVIDRVGSSIYECTFSTLESKDGVISYDNIDRIKTLIDSSTVVAIGSGMSVTDDSKKLVKEVIDYCGKKSLPLVIDADGLNAIIDNVDIIKASSCKVILTPHVAELARLVKASNDEVKADRLRFATYLADKTGAIVVAKGVPTYITDSKKVYESYTGNSGLSRGGSGDVLTGIIAGLCSAIGDKATLLDIAATGVYMFGYSADIVAENMSMQAMLPSDVIEALPQAFNIGF